MDSISRWIAKHQQIVYFTTCGVLGVLLAMMKTRFGLPFFPTILPVIAIVYIVALSIVSCGVRFQEHARKIMVEQCDPYPFLKEVQTQLSYSNFPFYEILLRINLANALYNTGATQAALDVMNRIPVEKKRSLKPHVKAMYYNNLASYLQDLGNISAAEDAYRKYAELADGKARKALMKHYPNLPPMAEAGHLYRMGEYAAAMEKCRAVVPATAYIRVSLAMLNARCAADLGDTEAARRELQFVLDNGNRLAVVDRAKALLETL